MTIAVCLRPSKALKKIISYVLYNEISLSFDTL